MARNVIGKYPSSHNVELMGWYCIVKIPYILRSTHMTLMMTSLMMTSLMMMISQLVLMVHHVTGDVLEDDVIMDDVIVQEEPVT